MPLIPVAGVPLACVLLLALAAAPRDAAAGSRRVRLDDGWHFAFGPHDGAEREDYPDSGWEPVALPHTWNAQDAFTREPTFREGAGWYRRRVTLDRAWRGMRFALRFEAANQVADVYWNGTRVGHHVGGYTAFAVDVSGEARVGGVNLLAVRVDNAVGPVPPLIADYDFYGGIYRDAWLIVSDPVHFSLLDHGAPGAWAEAGAVSETCATVTVRGRLANASPRPARIEILARVLDPGGRVVLAPRAEVVAPARSDTAFALPAGDIRTPRLWSPEAPSLYAVEVELRVDGHLVDATRSPLGLRWFQVDPDRGLTLNGRPLRLNGTNRHQDRAGLGNAVPERLQREDVRRIRADGFNFVRLAHYPQSEAVLDECDRLGLVVWEEIPVVNRVDPSAEFESNARAMLVEMIRQHRAHPSILFWGLANEVLLLKPGPLPAGYVARAVSIVRGLRALARAEDPGRLTAAAVSLDEVDDGSGLQDIPDVLGLNLYFGWYYRGLDELGPWLDRFHARHPDRPVVVSEYGADSDERVHARDPRALDFSIEYQQRFHEATFPQLAARPWLVGTAVWNQFDFGSRHRDDTKPNLNKKGLYFFDRRPKDVAFYYRAKLSPGPVLHIAARDWPRRAGSRPGDERQSVPVYSNLAEVALWRDGEPLGTRRVENGVARWEVAMRPGANVLIARGTRDGRALEDRCEVEYEDRSAACTPSAPRYFTLAMLASPCQVLDAGGTAWEACRDYAPGSWGRVGGTPATTRHRIFGTTDDALFQSTLEGVRALRFDVPDGEYDVELRFAETEGKRPGERVFGVAANGAPLCVDLDLAGIAGPFVAVTKTARVRCRKGGGLRLEFTAARGEATVSAVRMTRR
ncbi:MAG TPA: glycoside hydrolase family 2 TIM barrel-domain containing protein [Candidatus Eisenbacteria bacterium]